MEIEKDGEERERCRNGSEEVGKEREEKASNSVKLGGWRKSSDLSGGWRVP